MHLPAGLLRAVLAVLHPLRLSRYGPEQVDFLRYRPVLDNRRLKEELGLSAAHDLRRGLRFLLPHARVGSGATSDASVVRWRHGDGERRGRRARPRIGGSFARAGSRVVLLDRDADAVAAAGRELEQAGHDVLALPCDVTDPTACESAVTLALERFGRIDVVINNAGITHRSAFAATQHRGAASRDGREPVRCDQPDTRGTAVAEVRRVA